MKDWPNKATVDPDTIAAWWRREPYQNIGIATGRGILALDFDCKAGKRGLESLAALEKFGLPTSWMTRTPTGGRHVLVRLPEGVAAPTNTDQFKVRGLELPGVDLRGDRGFIVAPGSTINGVAYEVLSEGPIPPAAQWLVEAIQHASKTTGNHEAVDRNPLVGLDDPSAIARAIKYLRGPAPKAIEGDGGDAATFRVAARLRDFGLSDEVAFELLSEHWNETDKASPPWDPEDLRRKVANAYRYATGVWGGASGLAEFEGVEMPVEPPSVAEKWGIRWITELDPLNIPKRQWVLGTFLAKGFLASMVAPSSAGKTTLEISMAVALATGRSDIIGMKVPKRERVFLWNQEDDDNELNRRLCAVMKAFDVPWTDILAEDGRPLLMLGSGVSHGLLVAEKGPAGTIVPTRDIKAIANYLRELEVGVAIFDPLIELHQADENDNPQMAAVTRVFREHIAVPHQIAVLIAHHTRKPSTGDSTGHIGNIDLGRGAGSVNAVTRMGATLYTFDKKTAQAYGVPEEERHRYVRFDDGKGNMSLAGGEPLFFKRKGINIRNFEDPENVGVLLPVKLDKRKSAADEKSALLAEAIDLALGRAGSMPVRQLADTILYSNNPLFADTKRDTLARRISRLAEKPAAHFSLRNVHRPGLKGTHQVLFRTPRQSAIPGVSEDHNHE